MRDESAADWSELDDWWLDEVEDPAYAEDVLPLLLMALDPAPGHRYLDLGCGEGRVMGAVAGRGASAIGVDVNPALLGRAGRHGQVLQARLPDLAWARDDAVDGAYVVLALEHLHDIDTLFEEAARVVTSGGVFAAVVNHPVYTAPGSGPILDPTDGEIFWRFGAYLDPGSTIEPAGGDGVEFVHRSMSTLLNAAAAHGWMLESMAERGVGAGSIERDPILAKHGQLPHLLAARWRLR